MASFFLLIASCFLLRTAGKVSARAWTKNLSPLSLFCLSALCLDSFYVSPFWMSFICRVIIAGKAQDWRQDHVKQSLTKLYTESKSRQSRFYKYSRHGHDLYIFKKEAGNFREELYLIYCQQRPISVQGSNCYLFSKYYYSKY